MFKRNLAILLVAGLVFGGGALALAQGQPESPSTGPGSSQAWADRQANREAARKCLHDAGDDQAKRAQCREQFKGGKGRKGGGGPLKRAVHGDLLVAGEGGKFETVPFDRGQVGQNSDAGKIVIDRPDGQQVTLGLTPETRFRGVEDAGQLREDEPALVTSRDGEALTVVQRDPAKTGPGSGNKEAPPGVQD